MNRQEPDAAHLTRRALLGSGAAVGAGVLLERAPSAQAAARKRPGRTRRKADVIVIGAGVAAMTAAREVVKAGRSVIVLEARGRVGGRTWNYDLGGGEVADLGAAFVGPTMNHVKALIAELALETFPVYNQGENVSSFGGHQTRYAANGPTSVVLANPAGADLLAAVVQLDQMAAEVPVGAPWTAPRAVEWDSQTFDTWKQANVVTPLARAAVDGILEATNAVQPRDASLLHVLRWIAACGDEHTVGTVERGVGTAGGAQDSRVVGGTNGITLAIARQLGRRVVLNTPARRIIQKSGRVIVECDHGRYTAKRLIVAIHPAFAGRLDYHPALPALRDQLTQRWPQGSYAKALAIYDKPFWREDGLTGQVFTDRYVSVTFDQSPRDGSPGVMAAFLGGSHARSWDAMDAAARRRTVLDDLVAYFGPRAGQPRDYFEARWSTETWSRGVPGFTAPGVLLDYGTALREAIGRIHWAGTETSDYWFVHMEGGVRSGERAAREVLAEIA